MRSTKWAPSIGERAVRLMWSLISTGVPGVQSSLRPPQPLVSTMVRQPAAAAVRTPWTTARDALALVVVRTGAEEQELAVAGPEAADRAGVALHGGAEKPGRSVVATSADGSPSAAAAGSQPEPSTRATS